MYFALDSRLKTCSEFAVGDIMHPVISRAHSARDAIHSQESCVMIHRVSHEIKLESATHTRSLIREQQPVSLRRACIRQTKIVIKKSQKMPLNIDRTAAAPWDGTTTSPDELYITIADI